MFKKCIQCGVFEMYKTERPQRESNCNKIIGDVVNWDGVRFASGNRVIAKLEENNETPSRVNVYEETEFNGENITVHRRTKIIHAKDHITI